MEELYKQNSQIVFYFLYSMCKDRFLVEDLMQETFVRAFESLERYDHSCKISTWLCQIAKHVLYQYWSRTRKEIFVELDDQLIDSSNTEQLAINRIELLDIWDKLQELPNTMRQVFLFRVVNELPYKKIGAILGKSENWSRVTFFRAKTILLKEVQNGENKL